MRRSRFRIAAKFAPLKIYSCSPGDGAVSVPSVLLFFFELFLPEGLSPVSADDSLVPVDFSALLDFFERLEPFVPELDVPPVVSDADSLPAPVPVIDSLPLWCGEEPGVVPPFAP